VRVLLDENLPHDLAGAVTGHSVSTVLGLGWAGTKNGALLKRAGDVCDAFITMDANLEHQQQLASLLFGVVVIGAPSNRMKDLLPLVPELLGAIDRVGPGTVEHVGASAKRRGGSRPVR
jgi:hypothetical protein